jgi:hypothetical protein
VYSTLGTGFGISENGKTVNYLELISPIIKILQDTKKQNKILETTVNELQTKISNLEKRIDILEKI